MARLRPISRNGRFGNQPTAVDSPRLQIRVVPYSPPKIGSDVSTPSRSVSYAERSPKQPPLASYQDEENQPKHDIGGSSGLLAESQHRDSTAHEPLMDFAIETTDSIDQADQVENWSIASPSPSHRSPRRIIAVNSDKTFSLIPQSCSSVSTTEGLRSPRRSSTAPSSSADRTVSETFVDDQPSSPLTQELPRPPSSSCSTLLPASIALASTREYALVGGVRKVPNSEEGSKSNALSMSSSLSAGRNLQAEFAESHTEASGFVRPGILALKKSSLSSESISTLSERSNYKTFVSESPCGGTGRRIEAADDWNVNYTNLSSSNCNFDIIGESCSEESLRNRSRSDTVDSDGNYVLHEEFSSPPRAAVSSSSVLKTEYSRESLVVAPLRPKKRSFSDQVTICRQESRDSVRSVSLTSISSAFVEEAALSLFAGSSVITPHGGGFRNISTRRNSSIKPANRHLNLVHNHQWFTTLSPVLSESDRGSAVPSLTLSHTTAGDHRSNSYSLDPSTPGLPRRDGQLNVETRVDLPHPASYRVLNRDVNSSSLRLIRNQDEHGDGLAELEELQRRPSRTRLHSYLPNFPSEWNLRSSGGSRSNSFSHSYIPAWARLYYGSGERRLLTIQHSSDSLRSEFSASVRNSPFLSRSPSAERFKPVTRLPHQPASPPLPPASCEAQSASRLDDCIVSSPTTNNRDLEQGENGSEPGQDSANCYSKVKWWRNFNRYMSVIGLLLVGAVVALIVASTQQRQRKS
ncbi:serine-rich protein [Metarhizium album ARSEF 1941]|uniref:Serine-rich protein n=1 Tax=Metarhizium album (strain ARSEF 1941) TaxID=1081103 RepID=A0A0B2WVP0_METAS|nr:serine-rich protein [Metarhizium album ARSEF 1941]KHN97684.1 serine-rich protein [Metarhizium album ARSEF 1941]